MATKEKAPKKAPPPEEPREARGGPPPEAATAPAKRGPLILVLLVAGAMIAGGAGAFLVMKALSGPSDSAPRASEAPEGGGEASLGEASPHGSAPSGEEEPIKAPSKSGGSSAASGGGHGGGGEAAAGAEGAAPAGPVTVKLDPFQTNLNSSGGRAYIKLTMSFEVDGQEGADQLTAQMDSVRDVIITFLMSVSADDISTPDGMVRLKSQIQSRVNNILTDHKVRKVNITDIAVQ